MFKTIKFYVFSIIILSLFFGSWGSSKVTVKAADFMDLKDVTGQNDPTANKINLVFINDNINGDFDSQVKNWLDWDTIPKNITVDGQSRLSWGFFSIEPNRSNRDKYNIWSINKSQVPNYPTTDGCFTLAKDMREKYGFNFVVPVRVVYNTDDFSTNRSGACHSERDAPNTISKIGDFNDLDWMLVKFSNLNNAFSNTILAHELSHAIFGLDDEYADNFNLKIGTPNAAENIDIAKSWWQDLEGQIDPFYYEWKKINENAGYSVIDESNFRVGYYPGGCLSTINSCVIPTKNSIMNYLYEAQVYGSINRRRIEQTYNLFDDNNNQSSSSSSQFSSQNSSSSQISSTSQSSLTKNVINLTVRTGGNDL